METNGRVESTPVTLSCAACQEEIPVSEQMSAEATDYVAHVCGLECYRRWIVASRTPGDDTF